MFYALSKILGALLSPVVWILLLLLLALWSRKYSRRWLLAAACTALLFSNPGLVNLVLNQYEAAPTHLGDRSYTYGLVLGGIFNQRIVGKSSPYNPQLSANRLLEAQQLYRQGKIRKLVISSGSTEILGPKVAESVLIRSYLIEQGMPAEDILIDSLSRNTFENAIYSKALIDQAGHRDSILLITSALHMPRAAAIFRKADVAFVPYPVDYEQRQWEWTPTTWLVPNSESLQYWESILHEWMGQIVYTLRGWR